MIYCEQCEHSVKLVTINQASILLNVSRRTVYNYIYAERVHTYKTASGRFRLCLRSLVGPEQAKVELAYPAAPSEKVLVA